MIKEILVWLAVAFGLAAAALWYISTKVVVSPAESRMGVKVLGTIEGKPAEFFATALQQVKWNRWAALATAAASACQALALSLPPHSL